MSVDPILSATRQHLAELGYELVDYRRAGTSNRPVLKLRIDRLEGAPGTGVTTEDCATASRALERVLEGEGLVGPRYVLEVSSPGLERPVRWPAHWRRFAGRRVRVRAAGLAGQPEAEILRVPDEEHVVIRLGDGEERVLAFSDIRDAHLVVDWDAYGKR